MATFRFVNRDIDIHWNGYDITGPAGTVFSIPDQLYEEFESDLRPVEPSLEWIDTNEFQTLENQVSTATLSADLPIAITTSTTGKTISLNSGTALNGYLLVADGAGGTIWNPASTSGLTSVVGVSPISTTIAGGVASVSLSANYQTAGTYVNAVIGTSPASVSTSSGTSTVSIDQAAITGATAATNAQVVRFYVKNTTGTTIPKGSAVYVSGATGDNAIISLASATADPTSSRTLGLTLTDIATDDFGYVVESGYITDIDTSSTTAGAAVWLGNTPGSLVFVSPPAEPSHAVYLGVVVRVQSMNGSILVKVQNGYELDELHDVFVGGVSTALPLVYNSTSSGWVAQALTSVGVADDAIVTTKILDSAVTSAKVADNAIITSKILDAAVTSAKIAAGAVGSAAISAAAINSTHIGENAVVAGYIAANAVTSGNIAAGAVGSSQLADNAVVAAKIAAASVGTTALTSGSAANGTVLTANGSGGASFSSFSASAVEQLSTSTTTIVNGVVSAVTNTTAQVTGTIPSIAVDETNKQLFQIISRTQIRKIDLVANTVISTTTIVTNANEKLYDLAFAESKLIAVSGPTAALGAAQYFIINPSAMTVQNTGNIKGATNALFNTATPSVHYDPQNANFTIMITTTTDTTGGSAAAAALRAVFRVVNPSTYSTRVHTFTEQRYTRPGEPSTSNSAYLGHPCWIASGSRWAFPRYGLSGSNGSLEYHSDSGASTAFLAVTGRSIFGTTNRIPIEVVIDPSSSSSFVYVAEQGASFSGYERVRSISLATLSVDYNDTTVTTTRSSSSSALTTATITEMGAFDVRLINNQVYILFGTEIFNGEYIRSESGRKAYGANPFGLLSSQQFNGVSDFGSSQLLYYDGTKVNVIVGRNDSTLNSMYWRKAVLGTANDWDVVPSTNTAAYILGNDATGSVAGSIYGLASTRTNLITFAHTTTTDNPKRIDYVPVSSGVRITYYPDFSGTDATATFTFWRIR